MPNLLVTYGIVLVKHPLPYALGVVGFRAPNIRPEAKSRRLHYIEVGVPISARVLKPLTRLKRTRGTFIASNLKFLCKHGVHFRISGFGYTYEFSFQKS